MRHYWLDLRQRWFSASIRLEMEIRPKDVDPVVEFLVSETDGSSWSVYYAASEVIELGARHRRDGLLLARGKDICLWREEVYRAADWVECVLGPTWHAPGPEPPKRTYPRPEGLEDLDGLEHFAVRLSVGFGGPEDPTVEFWKKEPYVLVGAMRVSALKVADEQALDVKFDDRRVLLHEHVARVGIWVAAKLGFVRREPLLSPEPVDPDRVQTERIKKLQTMLEEQRQHLLQTVSDPDAKADLLDELTRLYRDKMMEVLRHENTP